MATAATITEERIVGLEVKIAELARERDEYHRLYLSALEQIKKLERGLLGQKAERFSTNESQLALGLLETLLCEHVAEYEDSEERDVDEPDDSERIQPAKSPRPRGRKKLPEELPRVDIEIIPEEVQREGLDAYKRIGEDVSESVEHRSASKVVVRVVKPKFVRKQTSEAEKAEDKREVFVAETPELPIPRSNAGPGMVADSIVRRWQDHIPLNRLEGIYAREGLSFSRSTMCGWHQQLAELCHPLIDAMWKDALKQPYLCTDATGVLVQAKDQCRRGHFWVLIAPELHVLYRYSRRHDSEAADRLVDGYQGYLVADAHAVYDHLFESGSITEVACWAHARRYAFKALGSDPERAQTALGFITALFRIERSIANAPRKKRESVRQKKSKPIVDRYFAWCDAEADHVLDDTPIARTIAYSRNQREALRRFLDDGRLPICNNISERHLRREVTGRKNWLFVGSDDGAEANTVFVTLLACCQIHGIEPWAYLRDLFCLLPRWPMNRVLELAPAYWKKTLEHEDTQRRLDANIYRRVSLGLDPLHHDEQ